MEKRNLKNDHFSQSTQKTQYDVRKINREMTEMYSKTRFSEKSYFYNFDLTSNMLSHDVSFEISARADSTLNLSFNFNFQSDGLFLIAVEFNGVLIYKNKTNVKTLSPSLFVTCKSSNEIRVILVGFVPTVCIGHLQLFGEFEKVASYSDTAFDFQNKIYTLKDTIYSRKLERFVGANELFLHNLNGTFSIDKHFSFGKLSQIEDGFARDKMIYYITTPPNLMAQIKTSLDDFYSYQFFYLHGGNQRFCMVPSTNPTYLFVMVEMLDGSATIIHYTEDYQTNTQFIYNKLAIKAKRLYPINYKNDSEVLFVGVIIHAEDNTYYLSINERDLGYANLFEDNSKLINLGIGESINAYLDGNTLRVFISTSEKVIFSTYSIENFEDDSYYLNSIERREFNNVDAGFFVFDKILFKKNNAFEFLNE